MLFLAGGERRAHFGSALRAEALPKEGRGSQGPNEMWEGDAVYHRRPKSHSHRTPYNNVFTLLRATLQAGGRF